MPEEELVDHLRPSVAFSHQSCACFGSLSITAQRNALGCNPGKAGLHHERRRKMMFPLWNLAPLCPLVANSAPLTPYLTVPGPLRDAVRGHVVAHVLLECSRARWRRAWRAAWSRSSMCTVACSPRRPRQSSVCVTVWYLTKLAIFFLARGSEASSVHRLSSSHTISSALS